MSMGYGGGPSAAPPIKRPSQTFGTISKGLNLATGIFQAAGLFNQAATFASHGRALAQNARLALEQGFQTAIDIREEGRDILGAQQAVFAKQGTLLEGSPLLILAETSRRIERNAQRAVKQARLQSIELNRQARAAKRAERRAKYGAVGGIAGSVRGLFVG